MELTEYKQAEEKKLKLFFLGGITISFFVHARIVSKAGLCKPDSVKNTLRHCRYEKLQH
jgi:hypothetical protein